MSSGEEAVINRYVRRACPCAGPPRRGTAHRGGSALATARDSPRGQTVKGRGAGSLSPRSALGCVLRMYGSSRPAPGGGPRLRAAGRLAAPGGARGADLNADPALELDPPARAPAPGRVVVSS